MFASANYATRPQQFLYFFPLPQGQGSLRPTFGPPRRTGRASFIFPAPSPFPPALAIEGWGWGIGFDAADPTAGGCSFYKKLGSVARKIFNVLRFEVRREQMWKNSF